MIKRKLVALMCMISMLLSVMPIAAVDITALDLSENQTRFSATGETGTLIVYGLSGSETQRVREDVIDNSLLTFSTSNAGVASVDENGNYSINGEGIAIITVKYGDVESGMIFYCNTEDNLFTIDENLKSSWVEKAYDEFRDKEDVLKIKTMIDPRLTDTTYVMGGWFYDSTDTSDTSLWYKFGPRGLKGERPLWGAYLNTWGYLTASVMSCSDYVNTVAVKKDSRIKGWHQFFVVIQRVNSTTHYMTFFDGELVLKGTTSSEVTPYYIDQMTTLCQEAYIAPYATTDFDFASINIEDGATDVPADTAIELNFNRALSGSSEINAVLTDSTNNQEIELMPVNIDGNRITLKPKYDLAYDTDYILNISGSVISEEDMFSPAASLDVSADISFTTKKAELYAENLAIEKNSALSFSADIVNNGEMADVWLIAAQFDGSGVQKQLTVKKTQNAQTGAAEAIYGAEINADASLAEGYVWKGLNELEAESLSLPVFTDVYERETADANTQTENYADVGYSPDNGLVEVHGHSVTNRCGLPVLIRVMNPGQNYETVTADNAGEVFARVEQIATGEGGSFDYKFELEGAPGIYKVIVNMPFAEAIKDEINFASRDDVYKYMGYVQNPDTYPKEADSNEIFAEARKVLDLNYSVLDTLEYKNILYSMLAKADDFETFREFSAFYNEAVEVVSIFETNDFEKIEARKNDWKIGDLSVYEIYTDMTDERKADINKDILSAGFDSYEALSNKFAESIILKEIKAVDNYSEIYPILKKVKDCFKNDKPTMDFDDYSALSETKKGTAMKAFSKKLEELSSKADIITEFNKAVDDAAKTSNSDGGGGSRPSSSGGLKGGSGSNKTDVITGSFEVQPENVMGSQTPQWVEEERELKSRKVFNDIESVPWAEEAIRELYNRGIISGKAEGIFAPNDYLTREELAKMLIGAMALKVDGAVACDMADVDRNAWYAPFADAAVEAGIIQGTGDGTFGVGALVNREEICTIADRAAQKAGIYLDDEFTIRPFFDEKQISSWALYSVNKMRESFVISGVGGNNFDPKSPVTRAQAAKIIYGLLAYAEL